jgi:peptidoglycan/xylan/chitin deacetylase (PgdA/CDA1 family)
MAGVKRQDGKTARRQDSRIPQPVTLLALLCSVFLLSACTAGAPAVVAPTASGDAVAVAVAAETTDSAPEALQPVASSQQPAANGVSFAQDVPDVVAPVSAPVSKTEDSVGGVAAAPAAQAVRPPPPPDPGTGYSQLIEGGGNGRLEVALTFDAGADRGYGDQILDLLRDEGIPATFGMTGLWAQENGDLVQRMVAEGHQLINHTWDHASLTGANTGLPPQTPEEVAQELGDTEAVVRDLTGYEMKPYFRPPYGDYDEASLGYLSNNGYYLSIWWTCDSHGWAGWGAQEIIDYCTANLREDEIMLFHVGAVAVGDFEALPGIIQFFRDAGYAFVTVEQMLQP